MKKKKQILGLITLTLLVVYACCKKDEINDYRSSKTPNLAKTTKGGCFIGKSANQTSDTIYYEVNNDTLLLHVTVNKNCSNEPVDSVIINQANVNIYLKDQYQPNTYCTCDYKFTYQFTNFNTIQNFNVYYKDFNSVNYSFWNSLAYP